MTAIPPTSRYAREESARVAGLLLIVRRDGLPLGAPPGLRRYVKPDIPDAMMPDMTLIERLHTITGARPTCAVNPARNGSVPEDGKPVPTHQQIKAWREAAGLSQRELAEKADVGRSTMAQAERPRGVHHASFLMLRHLATVLGHGDPAEWGTS